MSAVGVVTAMQIGREGALVADGCVFMPPSCAIIPYRQVIVTSPCGFGGVGTAFAGNARAVQAEISN